MQMQLLAILSCQGSGSQVQGALTAAPQQLKLADPPASCAVRTPAQPVKLPKCTYRQRRPQLPAAAVSCCTESSTATAAKRQSPAANCLLFSSSSAAICCKLTSCTAVTCTAAASAESESRACMAMNRPMHRGRQRVWYQTRPQPAQLLELLD